MIREKSLILRCISFMERGVGSAWGLPVIAAGKERLSALSLSEKLQAPGIVSFGADPFREEHLREMETLGIGPLGRYLGGEPIKPVHLGPKDFFTADFFKQNNPQQKNDRNSAGLFCTGLEFDNTHWVADGTPQELFRGHLEFLRIWGFSGGISIDEPLLAPLLVNYVLYLQKETSREKPGIVVLVSKHFFETQLDAHLPNAKVSADPAAGEIPINYAAGNVPVLRGEIPGLSIAFYEDLTAMLRIQKARCDILVTVTAGSQKNQRSESAYAEEITARLKLTVSTDGLKKKKSEEKKERSLNNYLFRDCSALPFPANRKTECGIMMEDDRVEKTGGCLFAVNTKFSGLRASDFKEEQALFYHEGSGIVKPATSVKQEQPVKLAPPVRNNASFIGLNQTQMEFFLHWRSECRRGYVRIMPGSMYIETYIALYADELALCMGKEGPMQHFSALIQLFHSCIEHYPETAERLCKYCVDFAVIYEIGTEAFPILLSELLNSGWFNETHNDLGDTEALLIDLAISNFFIEAENNIEKQKYWPLIKKLIPPRFLARKENDTELPAQFCRTLGILDTQLRRDWNKSFFTLFFPPLLQNYDCTAFENGRFLGNSSYTVLRPGFSTHKPLIDILAALVLTPERNPLPGVKARLHPLSLENELLETLRKESDEVREMLTLEDTVYDSPRKKARIAHQPKALAEPTLFGSTYTPVTKAELAEFTASLGAANQQALKNFIDMIQRHVIQEPATKPAAFSDTAIDEINAAFYERFGDLLIETGPQGPSISSEYAAILREWE